MISLLEAHLEVVLPLSGYLVVHSALVIDILGRLGHTALVLRQVVKLVGPESKIGLCPSVAVEYLVRILFSLLYRQHVVFLIRFSLAEGFLSCGFRKFVILGRKIRPAKLIYEL